MHSLTAAGPSCCILIGGCGPLGPIPGLHLLESPPVVAGIAQQQRLVGLADRCAAVKLCVCVFILHAHVQRMTRTVL